MLVTVTRTRTRHTVTYYDSWLFTFIFTPSGDAVLASGNLVVITWDLTLCFTARGLHGHVACAASPLSVSEWGHGVS